jgi:hypothetical protein
LTLDEKVEAKNIDALVKQTEEDLSTELSGWVKQTQDTIDKFYTKNENGKVISNTPTNA